MKWYTVCDSRLKAAKWINTPGCCSSYWGGTAPQGCPFRTLTSHYLHHHMRQLPSAASAAPNLAVHLRSKDHLTSKYLVMLKQSTSSALRCFGKERLKRNVTVLFFVFLSGSKWSSHQLYWSLVIIFLFASSISARIEGRVTHWHCPSIKQRVAATQTQSVFILNSFFLKCECNSLKQQQVPEHHLNESRWKLFVFKVKVLFQVPLITP